MEILTLVCERPAAHDKNSSNFFAVYMVVLGFFMMFKMI
jgi:hypothetical protein